MAGASRLSGAGSAMSGYSDESEFEGSIYGDDPIKAAVKAQKAAARMAKRQKAKADEKKNALLEAAKKGRQAQLEKLLSGFEADKVLSGT